MSGPIPSRTRELISRRDGTQCFRCGCGGAHELHHRRRRRDGGHHLSNLIRLCTTCHQWVHAHPDEARAGGWIVSAYVANPAVIPVRHYTGDQVMLDDTGGIHWFPPRQPETVRPLTQ